MLSVVSSPRVMLFQLQNDEASKLARDARYVRV